MAAEPATVTRMNVVVGDKVRFAAEIGGPGPLCRVDLWAAERWLTCDDNTVYVPQFRRDVLHTAARLRLGEGLPVPFAGYSAESAHRRLVRRAEDSASATDDQSRDGFQALLWGPTTDNVITCLFRESDHVVITLEFWREDHLVNHPEDAGAVLVVEIPAEEFIALLESIAAALPGSDRSCP